MICAIIAKNRIIKITIILCMFCACTALPILSTLLQHLKTISNFYSFFRNFLNTTIMIFSTLLHILLNTIKLILTIINSLQIITKSLYVKSLKHVTKGKFITTGHIRYDLFLVTVHYHIRNYAILLVTTCIHHFSHIFTTLQHSRRYSV